MGKLLRIMWAIRTPGIRRFGSGNLLIKNIHQDRDAGYIYHQYAKLGDIAAVKSCISKNQKI